MSADTSTAACRGCCLASLGADLVTTVGETGGATADTCCTGATVSLAGLAELLAAVAAEGVATACGGRDGCAGCGVGTGPPPRTASWPAPGPATIPSAPSIACCCRICISMACCWCITSCCWADGCAGAATFGDGGLIWFPNRSVSSVSKP